MQLVEPEFGRAAAERGLLVGLRAWRTGAAAASVARLARRIAKLAPGAPGYAELALGLVRGSAWRWR